MLVEIGVKNIALLTDVRVTFGEGFNVITGETGAGKSILIESLKMALGEKVPDLLIPDEKEGMVEIIYDDSGRGEGFLSIENSGIDTGDELIMRRKITTSGRSRIYVNDTAVTAKFLGEMTAELVNILGQHEYQKLFGTRNATRLLDAFAGNIKIYGDYADSYREWRKILVKISSSRDRNPHLDEKLETLESSIRELEGLNLKEDEAGSIERDLPILKNAAKIKEAVRDATDMIEQGEVSSLSLLKSSIDRLEGVAGFDQSLMRILERLKEHFYVINDISRDLVNCFLEIELDEDRYEELALRLSHLKRLGRKFGVDPEMLPDKLTELTEERAGLAGFSGALKELEGKESEGRERLKALSKELSERRKNVSGEFESEVSKELADLGLEDARFRVKLEETGEGYSIYGKEKVEFLFSPARAIEPGPLTKIASGGELSRVMLAIHNSTSVREGFSTLIFDEVDSGIGGKMAEMVGEKLKKISRSSQVICITHLPQIAALADHHVKVLKKKEKGRERAMAMSLYGEERVKELARMVSGEKVSEEAKDYARSLLQK